MNKLSVTHFLVFFVLALTFFIEFNGSLSSPTFNLKYQNFSDGQPFEKNVNLDTPVSLKENTAESLSLNFKPNGYSTLVNISMSVLGTAPYYKYNRLGTKPFNCKEIGNKNRCTISITLNPNQNSTILIYAKNGDFVLQDYQVQLVKAKRASQISGLVIFYFFILLATLGFIFTFLKKTYSEVLLLTITGIALASLSSHIFFLIISFVITCFIFLRTLLKTKKNSTKIFLFSIAFVVSILFLVKLLIPVASPYFENPGSLPLAVPLGFSYFIIKIIDLFIDAYKKNLNDLTLREYLLFILFPSTLPAGPIISYEQFIACRIKNYSVVHYSSGLGRVIFGVSKKLLADTWILTEITFKIIEFSMWGENYTYDYSELIFELLVLNVLYIYLDFSAYCDMAIGSARSIGYEMPENFKWPLLRTSITEFWKNWHITLSNWARKNIFMNVILSTRSIFLAIFSTMLCIGLWHKLSVGWISWAFHHSLIMRFEDYFKKQGYISFVESYLHPKIFKISGIAYVWYMVALGQSFIIFSNYELSLQAYKAMLLIPFLFIYELLCCLV